jgi:hypothetical protein
MNKSSEAWSLGLFAALGVMLTLAARSLSLVSFCELPSPF